MTGGSSAANGRVQLFKIDCEGCEWEVFEQLAKSDPDLLGLVDQVLLEVHLIEKMQFTLSRLSLMVDLLFRRHGFCAVHRTLNPSSVFNQNSFELPHDLRRANKEASLWSFWEITLIRPPAGVTCVNSLIPRPSSSSKRGLFGR